MCFALHPFILLGGAILRTLPGAADVDAYCRLQNALAACKTLELEHKQSAARVVAVNRVRNLIYFNTAGCSKQDLHRYELAHCFCGTQAQQRSVLRAALLQQTRWNSAKSRASRVARS